MSILLCFTWWACTGCGNCQEDPEGWGCKSGDGTLSKRTPNPPCILKAPLNSDERWNHNYKTRLIKKHMMWHKHSISPADVFVEKMEQVFLPEGARLVIFHSPNITQGRLKTVYKHVQWQDLHNPTREGCRVREEGGGVGKGMWYLHMMEHVYECFLPLACFCTTLQLIIKVLQTK